MALMKTWIVVADYRKTRFYCSDNRDHEMNLIKTVTNNFSSKVEGKKQRGSAVKTTNIGTRMLVDENSQQRRVINHYITELADEIEKARAENRFQSLILVAGPELMGQLKPKLTKSTLRLVERSLSKDLTRFNDRAIFQLLDDDIRHSFMSAS